MRTLAVAGAVALSFALGALACDPPAAAPAPALPSAQSAPAGVAPPVPGDPPSTELAPAPFTSAQIRDASRPGRTWVWYVEVAGRAAVRRRVSITKVEPERAEMESAVLDDTGKEIERTPPRSVAWDDLRKHGEFPKAKLTTREEVIKAPAGVFACLVYVVQEAPDEVTTYYFAKQLPGAPIYFFTDKAGQRTMTSTLLDHRPGW
jgi:hypothetical protein